MRHPHLGPCLLLVLLAVPVVAQELTLEPARPTPGRPFVVTYHGHLSDRCDHVYDPVFHAVGDSLFFRVDHYWSSTEKYLMVSIPFEVDIPVAGTPEGDYVLVWRALYSAEDGDQAWNMYAYPLTIGEATATEGRPWTGIKAPYRGPLQAESKALASLPAS